ncbi:MAG: hypothetical protein HZA17_00395 [Nitrospirae bacterium]|nr:hypothetical protein [Nitrospirota bacterium]
MQDKKKNDVRLTEQDEMIGRVIVRNIANERSEGKCLTDEEIAMFIDKTDTEREKMMEHLAACDSCRSILREAVDLQEDMKLNASGQPRRLFYYAMPVAVAAGLLVFVMYRNPVPVQRQQKDMPVIAQPGQIKPRSDNAPDALKNEAVARKEVQRPSAGEIASQLFTRETAAPLIKSMKTEKSASYGFISTGQAEKAAFRAGVVLTDLELSLRAGDREKSLVFLNSLVALLESLEDASAPIASCKAALEGVGQNSPTEKFIGISREIEKYLKGKSLPDMAAFGSWAEGGRLAAAIEKRDFLAYYNGGKYIIESVAKKSIPVGAGASLKKIKSIADKKEAQPHISKRLEREFENLILLME